MPVRIRLTRHGRKKRPFYRIVVASSEAPRDGRFIEQVGIYDPCQHPALVKFKQERLELWLRRGAKPTETVAQLIRKAGAQPAAAAEPRRCP